MPQFRRLDCRVASPITLIQRPKKLHHLVFHELRILFHNDLLHSCRYNHQRFIQSEKTDLVSGLFLSDPDLRAIILRDYAELKHKLYPSHAWKSTVILSGSILEAILLDVLSNSRNEASALAATRTPKKRGSVKPMENWRLVDLINVAEDLGLLPPDRAKAIDQVLRDYRNFVHPEKEIKTLHPCDENESMMAIGALGAFCDHLEATLTP